MTTNAKAAGTGSFDKIYYDAFADCWNKLTDDSPDFCHSTVPQLNSAC